jgi:hypothetical protein
MPPQQVYAFISVPENFPKWASGLCKSIRKTQEGWIAETPTGPMHVRFTEKNLYGVLDHYIQPESGTEIYIPMRVIANNHGSELIFTLFRLPGMSDEKFKEDAEWVAKDLKASKSLLEGMRAMEYS